MTSWEDLAAKLAAGALGGGAAVGGFWWWLGGRSKGQAELIAATAAFQTTVANQAQAFMETLRELVGQQQEIIAAQDRRIQAVEAEAENCRGENRQLHAKIDACLRLLQANGIDVPSDLPLVAITEVDMGAGVTLVAADRRVRTKKPTA